MDFFSSLLDLPLIFSIYTRRQFYMAKKYVYFFGGGKAEGKGNMKDLLGGKGAGLAEMTNIGLPVPAGFTITTEVCDFFYKSSRKYPQALQHRGGGRGKGGPPPQVRLRVRRHKGKKHKAQAPYPEVQVRSGHGRQRAGARAPHTQAQEGLRGAHKEPLPAGLDGAAPGRDRSGHRLLDGCKGGP